MTAERPSSPHTSGADSRCCDCLLPVPAGIGPRCSDCGLFRCSGRELYLMVRYALINHCRVRGGFREQLFDALTAYSTRVARARATMSERSSSSQEPPVSATAPILTRPPRPKVPSGWEAVYCLNDNAYYYWLRGTNHVQWEYPNITTVAVAGVVDWAEPTTTTTGTASVSVWDPPPHTTWLSGTNSLPPPAPRSRSASSLTASDSSQPLTGRSSSIYE